MQLSTHFTLEELTYSQIAARNGIDNLPGTEEIRNLIRLAALLERVRDVVGRPVDISSGYRSPELNALIPKSAKNSQHIKGCAADIKVKGISPDKLMQMIIDAGLPYDQIIREFDSWVHISIANTAEAKPRKQALITDKTGTRSYPHVVKSKTPPAIQREPEIMKPLQKSRTIKASATAGVGGTVMAGAGIVGAAAPAIGPVQSVVEMVQNNTAGFMIVVGLSIAVFAGYIIWRRYDDRRKAV